MTSKCPACRVAFGGIVLCVFAVLFGCGMLTGAHEWGTSGVSLGFWVIIAGLSEAVVVNLLKLAYHMGAREAERRKTGDPRL